LIVFDTGMQEFLDKLDAGGMDVALSTLVMTANDSNAKS
jgi:hypothetical protein